MGIAINVILGVVSFFMFFFLGGALASTMQCFIYRKNNDEDWFHGRSHCDSCGRVLSWWELIPVVGALYTGFTCPVCHEKFTKDYALMELSQGLVYGSIFLCYGYSWKTLIYLVVLTLIIFVVIFITECTHRRRQ